LSSESDAERFFEFMCKREALRLRKETGAPWPWSEDEILNTYKFTNVKRENDRTTRWMRRNWTGPNVDRPGGEIIFNCALFRYFGTWEFADALGWQRTWQPQRVVDLAQRRSREGLRVFTGAYIVPTLGYRGPKTKAVADLILTPLWKVREEIGELAAQTKSWRATAERMRRLPGFGGTGFMTKEVLQDVMQTPVLNAAVDRNTWCPAGPGARRGLNRLAGRGLKASVSEAHLLAEMLSLFERAQETLPSWMPVLELHDVQFQLCEFDKYERVRLGEGRPRSKYIPR
jgi:5-hmdU DNA kinase-like protein